MYIRYRTRDRNVACANKGYGGSRDIAKQAECSNKIMCQTEIHHSIASIFFTISTDGRPP